MNIIHYNPAYRSEDTSFKVGKKATELIRKFHQSPDGLTLKNWKTLSEILDYAAAAEQTIAEQKAYISDLESLTATDMLTGLLNRQGFEHEVKQAIAWAKRYGEISLFAFIDLDRFKVINDSYGHSAGDAMLKQVGMVLNGSIRETDFAARLSGDEFGLLLTRCDAQKAKERAGVIRHQLRKITIVHDGHELHTAASMGFAIINEKSELVDIFETADKAMYKNKRDRKRTKNKYHLT